MNEIKEKIQRWKIKADILISEDKRAFIIDVNNSYFFCDILISGEERLLFKPFKGNDSGKNVEKYWADITKFEEYIERIGDNNGR